MLDENFANRLKEACLEADLPWKQKDLAKEFNVSSPMAWNYMKGEKQPRMNKAKEIAIRLDICVEWLLSGRGPKRPGDALDLTGVPDPIKSAIETIARSSKEPNAPTGSDST